MARKSRRVALRRSVHNRNPKIVAVDLFCGAGGLTNGLAKAGIDVRLGVDIDPACEYPYTANNDAKFLRKSVVDLAAQEVSFGAQGLKLLAGCAPCQPFSTYHQKADSSDGRWNLLKHFGRLAEEVKPDLITMENVPNLETCLARQSSCGSSTNDFVNSLRKLKSEQINLTTALDIQGFIATVERPRDLKITGTEERATIDLFVNGRLREKNILRHIPSQRIIESYLYGQINCDSMDKAGSDPFTSSREGIVDGDESLAALLNI